MKRLTKEQQARMSRDGVITFVGLLVCSAVAAVVGVYAMEHIDDLQAALPASLKQATPPTVAKPTVAPPTVAPPTVAKATVSMPTVTVAKPVLPTASAPTAAKPAAVAPPMPGAPVCTTGTCNLPPTPPPMATSKAPVSLPPSSAALSAIKGGGTKDQVSSWWNNAMGWRRLIIKETDPDELMSLKVHYASARQKFDDAFAACFPNPPSIQYPPSVTTEKAKRDYLRTLFNSTKYDDPLYHAVLREILIVGEKDLKLP